MTGKYTPAGPIYTPDMLQWLNEASDSNMRWFFRGTPRDKLPHGVARRMKILQKENQKMYENTPLLGIEAAPQGQPVPPAARLVIEQKGGESHD